MSADLRTENVEIVKLGMQHLEKLYEDREAGRSPGPVDFRPFYDACADDVEFYIPITAKPADADSTVPPWNVVGNRWTGKSELIAAFDRDQAELTGWEVGAPLEYFVNEAGNRVVVLLKERYAVSDNPTIEWAESAMVFDVEGGKITQYVHLADMSAYLVSTGFLRRS